MHVHQGGAKTSNNVHASSSDTSSFSSSPIQRNVALEEHVDELDEYIEWHVHKSPTDEAALLAALEALKEESYKLKQLPRITEERWKVLGVPLSIGMALSDSIKAFKKQKYSHGIFS